MKIIGISFAILLTTAVFACQRPQGENSTGGGGGGAGMGEPAQEERLEEPQVRDGMPESTLRDSLTTDTTDTSLEDTL